MYEFLTILMACWVGITVKASLKEMLLLVITTVFLVLGMKFISKYERKMVKHVLFLFSVSMVIAYSYGRIRKIPITLLAGSGLFLAMYLFGKSVIYKWRIIGLIAVCMIPLLLLCTRMFGTSVENTSTYISIGPFLTLAGIMLLLPFAISFLLRSEIKISLWKNRISLNHLTMALWMALNAYLSGVVNSEYGTGLIICGTTTILFFMYGKYWIAKGGFCLLAGSAILLMIETSLKAQIRFTIFQDIKEAFQLYEAEAEPIIRILDTAPIYGLWGLGHGTFRSKTAINDYVISCLLMNYGIVFTMLVVSVLLFFIVRIFLIKIKEPCARIMVETYGVMLFVMTFLGIAGPINSFVLTGVGIPFLSVSGSINVSLLGFLGMVISLKEKGEEYEEKLFG